MKSAPLAIAAAAVLVLSGCSAAPAAPDDGRIQVVASTSVYGDLAATVGGDHVDVTSIISSPAHDPHSYEASARDQLAISRADLVIYNGGGYDPFIELLLDAAGTDPATVNAVEASGLLVGDAPHGDGNADGHGAHEHGNDVHEHGDNATGGPHGDDTEANAEDADAGGHHHHEINEHVWYDLHAVPRIVDAIAHELAVLDPAHSAEFEANAAELIAQVDALHERAHGITAATHGSFAVTEPVAVHLITSVGLNDVTPPAFAEAIEEGADVPPSALLSILNLIDSRELTLLAYNEQTTSPETERVLTAAQDAGVPVVAFAETLPEGLDFVAWMTGNLDRLEAVIR